MPTISVLMSVYNEPLEWVKEAIDSILTQTFSDFEFIIINDKPDREELGQFLEEEASNDHRIKVHTNPENIGLTKSLNVGLRLCSGKYIARMDADDISLETRLEKQFILLEKNPEVGIVGSWVKSFGSRRGIVRFNKEDRSIRFDQLYSSPFDHPATTMRASALSKLDFLYDENIKYAQDQEFWYRIGQIAEFANLQEVLYKHRYNKNQISHRYIKEQQENVKKIRRKLVSDFYSKLSLDELDYYNIKMKDIIYLKKQQKCKQLNSFDSRYSNYILKLMYFSLRDPKFSILLKGLLYAGDLSCNWTLKDIIKLCMKTLRPKSFITSGLI